MGTDIKNKLNALSPAQLKDLMKKLGKEKKALPHMPRNPEQVYHVNSAQKRMWFLSKLDPSSHLYTNPIGIRIKAKGKIDIDLFVKGFAVVARQHEIMRTSFLMRDGEVYQKVHDILDVCIIKKDLSELDPDEREAQLIELLKTDGQTVIDIEDYPLFRFTQVKLADNEYAFIYTSHHIISDAWSSSHIFRSMQDLYNKAANDEIIELPELKYQYIDYVYWEQKWLQSKEYQNTLAKWKEMIPEVPEAINLPTDYVRPATIDYKGALYKTTINKEVVDRLAEFSKKEGVNLFHTLLSAFNIILHKYSGDDQVVVGIPLANRKLKEFQQSVGMFLNTLPHRTVMTDEMTCREYLSHVRDISQQMMIYQDFPFDKLIEELQPPRDTSVSPIFQILFVFQNIPSMYDWDGLSVKPVKSDYSVSKYDLNLWAEEVEGSLYLSMTCQTSLFRKEIMPQFLYYYMHLLEEMLADPDKSIGELEISTVQYPELVRNDPGATHYINKFEQHVAAHTDKTALVCGDEQYTYSELDIAANRVANYLLKTKSDTDTVIGVMLDRSAWSIISLLGINKSGMAYLPIDPSLPQERLEYIIKDSGIKYIITEAAFSERLNAVTDNLLHVDEDVQKIKDSNSDRPVNIHINSSDLAYVIYTSGSTGLPKGVCVEHVQLLNYATAIQERLQLPEGAIYASVSAIYTDLGNTQIFPPLISGGYINFVSEELLYDPLKLVTYFSENKVDCLKIVPSHLSALLAGENSRELLPEQLLILGGERVTSSLILRIRALKPDLRIVNHYGPTETTIGILTYEIGKVNGNDIIPVGKPLANNTVFVANKKNRPQPAGIPGELVVCGTNVARGYHNQASLNSNSFIKDLNGIDGRYYKTGDLCRMREDGNIEFLGRVDDQFKIRGYRVEPAEIENILLKYPNVSEAVVLSDGQKLTAYLCSAKQQYSVDDIKHSLRSQLPSYMLPDEIVFVEKIPRLGSGKINLRGLKELVTSEVDEVEQTSVRPRDEVELTLAEIWQDVLKSELTDINQSFFDAGGNSLVAIEFIAKINKHFSTDIGINVLFESNTVNLLAAVIRSSSYPSQKKALVQLRKGDSDKYLFLVHPAGGDVLSYYDLAQTISREYTIYGLQADKTINDASIQYMAARYLQEISDNIRDGKFVFGGWSMGALVAYEMAIQLQEENGVSTPVIIFDQQAANGIETENSSSSLDRLAVFGEKIDHLTGRKTGLTKDALDGLTDKERSAMFLAEFKKSNLVPHDLKQEEFYGFLDTMINHNEITMKYACSNYNGKVLLIQASEVAFGTGSGETADDYGWGKYANENFSIAQVPGNHISMIRKPYVKELGIRVNQFLESV